jgi:glycosyltransferase involved in cell wall biosynthesis
MLCAAYNWLSINFIRSMPIHLSVTVITRNERANIETCLRSVAFADEWVVLDFGSTDGTQEMAKALGATVVESPDWPGFGVQKNRALQLAKGQWVLSLDADEHVSPALALEIQQVLLVMSFRASPDFAGNGCTMATGIPTGFCACFNESAVNSRTTWFTNA